MIGLLTYFDRKYFEQNFYELILNSHYVQPLSGMKYLYIRLKRLMEKNLCGSMNRHAIIKDRHWRRAMIEDLIKRLIRHPQLLGMTFVVHAKTEKRNMAAIVWYGRFHVMLSYTQLRRVTEPFLWRHNIVCERLSTKMKSKGLMSDTSRAREIFFHAPLYLIRFVCLVAFLTQTSMLIERMMNP